MNINFRPYTLEKYLEKQYKIFKYISFLLNKKNTHEKKIHEVIELRTPNKY